MLHEAHRLYCTDNALFDYVIRRTVGGFVVGLALALFLRPLVSAIRRWFGA